MKTLWTVPFLCAVAGIAVLAPIARGQSTLDRGASSSTTAVPYSSSIRHSHPDLLYVRPTEKMKLHSYIFDAFGPYPIFGAAFIAARNQARDKPPEWQQGAEGYGHRFGSTLGIGAVTTTTRYGLAELFREDTVYYRCDCKGILPRFWHAMISTVTARRGADGHRQLSFPAIIAPYAGTMTAVYAWYPARYGPKDALRMGNYSLLAFSGENFALEFIYGGPHTLFSHLHRPAFSGTDAASAPATKSE